MFERLQRVAFCAVWNHQKALIAVGTAYEPLLTNDDQKCGQKIEETRPL